MGGRFNPMLNDEIGTYTIAEAIAIKPDIIVRVDGRKITTIINGIELIGNWDIIKEVCKTSKLKKRKRLINNKVEQERTPEEVLSDVYGISKEMDWEMVYDPDEIWETSVKLAKKRQKINKQSKFKLNDDRRSL